jgi:SAM-dependent MidA family methyltransferase
MTEMADADPVTYEAAVMAAKTMLLPGEMGERFKLMLLTRRLSQDDLTAGWKDERHRL